MPFTPEQEKQLNAFVTRPGQKPDYAAIEKWLKENGFPVCDANVDALADGDVPYTESDIKDLDAESADWAKERAALGDFEG